MTKKYYLCIDLINPNTNKKETCKLANYDLKALYKYTSFVSNATELLSLLPILIGEYVKSNLANPINRDTFYIKEIDGCKENNYKVPYKEDEREIYVNKTDIINIIKKFFSLSKDDYYHSNYSKNMEKLYKYLLSVLSNDKRNGSDKAYELEDKIHNNFFIAFDTIKEPDMADCEMWQEIALVPSNIKLLTSYVCEDEHQLFILAKTLKDILRINLIDDETFNKRKKNYFIKLDKTNNNYASINVSIYENITKFAAFNKSTLPYVDDNQLSIDGFFKSPVKKKKKSPSNLTDKA